MCNYGNCSNLMPYDIVTLPRKEYDKLIKDCAELKFRNLSLEEKLREYEKPVRYEGC